MTTTLFSDIHNSETIVTSTISAELSSSSIGVVVIGLSIDAAADNDGNWRQHQQQQPPPPQQKKKKKKRQHEVGGGEEEEEEGVQEEGLEVEQPKHIQETS